MSRLFSEIRLTSKDVKLCKEVGKVGFAKLPGDVLKSLTHPKQANGYLRGILAECAVAKWGPFQWQQRNRDKYQKGESTTPDVGPYEVRSVPVVTPQHLIIREHDVMRNGKVRSSWGVKRDLKWLLVEVGTHHAKGCRCRIVGWMYGREFQELGKKFAPDRNEAPAWCVARDDLHSVEELEPDADWLSWKTGEKWVPLGGNSRRDRDRQGTVPG